MVRAGQAGANHGQLVSPSLFDADQLGVRASKSSLLTSVAESGAEPRFGEHGQSKGGAYGESIASLVKRAGSPGGRRPFRLAGWRGRPAREGCGQRPVRKGGEVFVAVPVSRLTGPEGRLRFGLVFSYGREHPKFAGRGRTSEEGDGQGPAEEGNRADHLAAQTDGRADHQAAHVAARWAGRRAAAGRTTHASTGSGACGRTGCCRSCGGCTAGIGSRCCPGGGPSHGCRTRGTAGARGPCGLGRGPGTGHRGDRGRGPCPAFGGVPGVPAAARVS